MATELPRHREVSDLIESDAAKAADAARELVAEQPGDEQAALLLARAVVEGAKDAPSRPEEEKPTPNSVLDKARDDLAANRDEEAVPKGNLFCTDDGVE